MAIPNAPLEGAGDKILFGVYNNAGTNAAALIHAVVTKTLNAETIGWLATATHADLATFAAGDPVSLSAGYDGTLVRKMLVDASGRQIVSGEVVDNAAFTDGTSRVLPSGYIFDEVAGTGLTENDAAAARIDSKRAQIGVIEDATTRGQRAAVSSVGSLAVDTRPLVVRLSQTPTVSSGAIYAAKDAVGGLLTFAGAVRANGGTGTVTGVQLVDKGQQMAETELVLFDRSVTAPTDNNIFAPSDTEASQIVGIVKVAVADYADYSTNSVASKAVDIPFKLEAATSSLFGALVTRGTPTYTSTSDVVVTITVQQN